MPTVRVRVCVHVWLYAIVTEFELVNCGFPSWLRPRRLLRPLQWKLNASTHVFNQLKRSSLTYIHTYIRTCIFTYPPYRPFGRPEHCQIYGFSLLVATAPTVGLSWALCGAVYKQRTCEPNLANINTIRNRKRSMWNCIVYIPYTSEECVCRW